MPSEHRTQHTNKQRKTTFPRSSSVERRQPAAQSPAPPVSPFLALQQQYGNAAISQLLQTESRPEQQVLTDSQNVPGLIQQRTPDAPELLQRNPNRRKRRQGVRLERSPFTPEELATMDQMTEQQQKQFEAGELTLDDVLVGKKQAPPNVFKAFKNKENFKAFAEGKVEQQVVKATSLPMAIGGQRLSNKQKAYLAQQLARNKYGLGVTNVYGKIIEKMQGEEWADIKRRKTEIEEGMYGPGKVGKALRILKGISTVCQIIGTVAGVVALIATVLGPVTDGATVPIATAAGIVGIVASSIVALLKLILIGHNIKRMRTLPKEERAAAKHQLILDTVDFVTALVNIALGAVGISGALDVGLLGGEEVAKNTAEKTIDATTNELKDKVVETPVKAGGKFAKKKALKSERKFYEDPTLEEKVRDVKNMGSLQPEGSPTGEVQEVVKTLLSTSHELDESVSAAQEAQTEGDETLATIEQHHKDKGAGAVEKLEQNVETIEQTSQSIDPDDIKGAKEANVTKQQITEANRKLDEAGVEREDEAAAEEATTTGEKSNKDERSKKSTKWWQKIGLPFLALKRRMKKATIKLQAKARKIALKIPGIRGPLKQLETGIEEDKSRGQSVTAELQASGSLVTQLNAKIKQLDSAVQNK